MNRYRSYGPRDEIPLSDGDGTFIGVDERGDPSSLQPGFVAMARNKRFRDGVAEDRRGIAIMNWMKGSNGQTRFTDVHGVGIFSDPNEVEWVLVAAEGKVWRTRPNTAATEVTLPAGVTLSGDVRFTQAFNVVILARGFAEPPLVMRSLDEGFITIAQFESDDGNGTGTLQIPNFLRAEFFQNRLVIVGDRDIGYVSDIQNYTRYTVQNAFRINEGSDDRLNRFFKFNDDTMVSFKDESVFQVRNLVPDEFGNWTEAVLDEVTKSHGLKAPDAVVNVGRDLFYFSTRGVASLGLTEQQKIHGRDQPLSEAMEKTMRRVNWRYADRVQMAYWDNRLYIALPLDQAEMRSVDNLVPLDATFSIGTPYSLTGLVVGRKYHFEEGDNTTTLSNGADIVESTGDFIAKSTTVFISTASGSSIPVDSGVYEVFQGVNNGVMVYDFLNQAWAGVDEADGVINVKQWFQTTMAGRKRLFFLGNDGRIHLYEEGFEDQKLVRVDDPYIDLLVLSVPVGAATVRVNGGTTITSVVASVNVGSNQWGVLDATTAGRNLWKDTNGKGGYDPTASSPWSAPNTTPEQIAGGVRFVATNGVLPTLTITGTWTGRITDAHSGTEIRPQAIESELLTRGYLCGDLDRKQFMETRLDGTTWAPRFTMSAKVDGVDEELALLEDETKDRTKYTVFGKADYDPTNTNDDHGDAYREDYSAVPDVLGIKLKSGVNFDQRQDWNEPARIQDWGRYVQLRVTKDQGWMAVRGVTVEARSDRRDLLSKV